MTPNDNKRPPDAEADGPALEQQDWTDLEGATDSVSTPQNGDLRYARSEGLQPGDLPGEDDDNPYQESDEALPPDSEEGAIRRDPTKEKDRFDEV
jgi:hypothetical protein